MGFGYVPPLWVGGSSGAADQGKLIPQRHGAIQISYETQRQEEAATSILCGTYSRAEQAGLSPSRGHLSAGPTPGSQMRDESKSISQPDD